MNPSIFKAYDIRGVVPVDLDAEAARAIGIGIARFLGAGRIAVGADMRESGRALRGALVAGLCGEGREVVDVGRLATPMLYFASTALDAAGGGIDIGAGANQFHAHESIVAGVRRHHQRRVAIAGNRSRSWTILILNQPEEGWALTGYLVLDAHMMESFMVPQ